MDIVSIISLVGSLIQASNDPGLRSLISGGIASITEAKINTEIPVLAPLFEKIGAMISPSAASAVHSTIGIVSALTSQTPLAEKIQAALNAYLANTAGFVPLIVDGIIGTKTNDAIRLAQTKAGIKVDGVVGKITAGVLGVALS